MSNISNISVMKKEHPGPPPMKWKGQHIFPFGLCVKELKSRFSSRLPSLPPVKNLTEFWKKTGSNVNRDLSLTSIVTWDLLNKCVGSIDTIGSIVHTGNVPPLK